MNIFIRTVNNYLSVKFRLSLINRKLTVFRQQFSNREGHTHTCSHPSTNDNTDEASLSALKMFAREKRRKKKAGGHSTD